MTIDRLTPEVNPMIRGILKNGRVEPLEPLPDDWHDGQEVFIDSEAVEVNEAELNCWHEELQRLAADIPAEDHQRIQEALAEDDRIAHDWMRREMELND